MSLQAIIDAVRRKKRQEKMTKEDLKKKQRGTLN